MCSFKHEQRIRRCSARVETTTVEMATATPESPRRVTRTDRGLLRMDIVHHTLERIRTNLDGLQIRQLHLQAQNMRHVASIAIIVHREGVRSEEHTSELQSQSN